MKQHIRSGELYVQACGVMPGGVNSPVRAFRAVGGDPLFIARGQGSHIFDVDNNDYIDYVCSWGPLILGHRDTEVAAALQQVLTEGTSFGASTPREVRLAEMIIESVPSIEKVRLVNSGTEATMSAIRLARACTGRSKFIKFAGCYHGHADSFLVQAGSGALTMGVPSSPGVPDAISDLTIVLPYNDLAAVEQTLKSQGDQIAAVIVEPVAANMGVVPPAQGYLEGLRQLTAQVGALLIFDEVITGFRLSLGGAQSFYGVTPDLTCLGKIIGGGLPVGAYGGKTEIMEMVAPEGSVYQAGTLSGNPLAVQAGITTLERLQQPGIYRELETRGRRLAEGLRQAAKNAGLQATVNQVGSLLSILFTAGPVNGLDAALESDLEQFRNYFQMMLEEGIYLAPSQFEALFVSLAHTDEDIERTISAAGRVLKHLPSKLACESSIRRQL